MDAYSRYNQIKMRPEDKDKTTFIIDYGIYCYKVMPFGLKNIGATFQRMVKKAFKKKIRHTMEVYVDDMMVKSIQCSDHLCHLGVFDLLQKYQVKLNPEKCTFKLAFENFLGYLVTQQGIEANPTRYP